MENYIQLKKDNILRIGIKTADGKETGEHLEFDLEDIELPLRINQSDIQHKRNIQDLKMKWAILEKKQDKKGKYILSWKEEEQIKLMNEFYKKEMEALDLFLGEGGTLKLLNGRNPYLSMYDDIGEILEPIMPKLKMNSDDIANKIKGKYKTEQSDVIE